jgi:hypothetical protein
VLKNSFFLKEIKGKIYGLKAPINSARRHRPASREKHLDCALKGQYNINPSYVKREKNAKSTYKYREKSVYLLTKIREKSVV